ncbi:hypothetical protein FOA52_003596 [Chlamydomonas sp. UWO 241]|nr:hypothetical protein FOA52_003596 [Chlamydomonas sp. UWO 241]
MLRMWSRGRSLDPKQLNRLITDSETADSLFSLAQQHGQSFDFIHARAVNMLWAIAKMGLRNKLFVSLLLMEAEPKLPSFNAQNMANTAWALATLGRKDTTFTGALLVAAKSKLPSFNAQDLATTAWALATLDYYDGVFMGELLGAVKPKVPSFILADETQMSIALTKFNTKDAEFERALEARRAQLGGK